jgi:katanin p60 ATPase-containing subunit A1
MYDNHKHVCVEGDHVVNIFSFSKAYGMMGWRIGYVSPVHQPLFLTQKVMI